MVKFSQNLRDELVDYLANVYGVEITQEQADSYLESLADYFLARNATQ